MCLSDQFQSFQFSIVSATSDSKQPSFVQNPIRFFRLSNEIGITDCLTVSESLVRLSMVLWISSCGWPNRCFYPFASASWKKLLMSRYLTRYTPNFNLLIFYLSVKPLKN